MNTVKRTFKSNINVDNGYTNVSQGEHEYTMELFFDDSGKPTVIEWDIPSLDDVEHIGLEVDGKKITGYDGVFEMPEQAITMLEDLGFDCSEVK